MSQGPPYLLTFQLFPSLTYLVSLSQIKPFACFIFFPLSPGDQNNSALWHQVTAWFYFQVCSSFSVLQPSVLLAFLSHSGSCHPAALPGATFPTEARDAGCRSDMLCVLCSASLSSNPVSGWGVSWDSPYIYLWLEGLFSDYSSI